MYTYPKIWEGGSEKKQGRAKAHGSAPANQSLESPSAVA